LKKGLKYLQIGQDKNYVALDADYGVKLEGETKVWDDVIVGLGDAVFKGVSDPVWTSFRGGQVLAFAKNQDNTIYFSAQIPHKYAVGEDIEFHLHCIYPDANAGDVKWNLTYSWASMGVKFDTETSVSKYIAASTKADTHTYIDIVDISGTDYQGNKQGISSILICCLQREGTDGGDDYNNDVYLINSVDFHIPINTLGSREEGSK